MEPLTKKESIRIWKMKAWAVLFIICAHCGGATANASFATVTASSMLTGFGSLGVPIFFFLAGYVFHYSGFLPWLERKITGVLVPWLVCGTLVYFYVTLRKGGISLASLAQWLMGVQTYLWYLPVMVVLWLVGILIFLGVKKRLWSVSVAAIVCGCLSVAVLCLEMLDVIHLQPYLSLFRWLWLFALGLIARQYQFLDKLPGGIYGAPILIVILLFLALAGVQVTYWAHTFYLLAPIAILLVALGAVPSENGLEYIGKVSFSTYLLHMPIAGLVANLCNRVADPTGILMIVRPVLVLLITVSAIWIVQKIGKRLRLDRMTKVLFGF